MNEDSSLLSGAAASRKKRDIIGEWPWQARSLLSVVAWGGILYRRLTGQFGYDNWFNRFFVIPALVCLVALHAYGLIAWGSARVIARFRDEDSTPPELD